MSILTNIHVWLILSCLQVVYSQTLEDSCTRVSLESLNTRILFDTSSLVCSNVWSSEGFVLRAGEAGPNLWSFVLSAPNTNSYVAIGFSPDGGMIGSTAVVGWLAADGSAIMRRYFLGGKNPSQVLPDQGTLQVMPNTSSIMLFSSRMLLAFQLVTYQPSSQLLFAVGSSNNPVPRPPNFQLSIHRDKISIEFDYESG
ncbi:hypothetical protein M8C21_007476 [Ambrosia artemisiifolia]|uniref:DOMON domain-containing protein n=1 Tax=Ambrosia artemisiifolia TaxID=4212 RepID=A0AAD5C0U3_AMBAR|nr:hypothetical protein M8C21_007476 [Ambrosia artemisiifolia]